MDTKIILTTPPGDPESETKELRRENVCCGSTKTMKLDPTQTKICIVVLQLTVLKGI